MKSVQILYKINQLSRKKQKIIDLVKILEVLRQKIMIYQVQKIHKFHPMEEIHKDNNCNLPVSILKEA